MHQFSTGDLIQTKRIKVLGLITNAKGSPYQTLTTGELIQTKRMKVLGLVINTKPIPGSPYQTLTVLVDKTLVKDVNSKYWEPFK